MIRLPRETKNSSILGKRKSACLVCFFVSTHRKKFAFGPESMQFAHPFGLCPGLSLQSHFICHFRFLIFYNLFVIISASSSFICVASSFICIAHLNKYLLVLLNIFYLYHAQASSSFCVIAHLLVLTNIFSSIEHDFYHVASAEHLLLHTTWMYVHITWMYVHMILM